jgi:LysR family nitrogen assimilation transcriptional regulator
MELRALRYFSAVVEAGSLSAAAAQLRLSQPSLSVAISRLESEVGVPLLTRSPRGVAPTSAGRYLLDASSRVLGEVDEIATTLRRFGQGLEGSLTIAAVPVLMWARLPRLLRALDREAPGVRVSLVDPPPWSAIDMLQQQGRVDLAAVMVADPERFARRHRGEFDIVDWGSVPLVGVLPPHRGDAPDPLPLREFDGVTVMLPQRTSAVPSLPEAVERGFLTHGIAPAEIRSAATIQSGMPLIEAGLAWAVLPDPDRESLSRFDVVVRGLSPELPPLQALVLLRKGAATDPTIARLLRLLAEESQDRV